MKRLILTTVLVSGLGLMSKAQEKPHTVKADTKHEHIQLSPQERAAKSAERAEKDLGLTTEQKAKWQAASLERINANEPLKVQMRASATPEERQALRKQMRGNGETFETTVNGFLTAEQKTKRDEVKQSRHHHKHKCGTKHEKHGKHKKENGGKVSPKASPQVQPKIDTK
ncbi:MAG: hypothetical protein KF900_05390 [Bacteroidetes bacterium]|nr:hypothetical protein [Bacteroidota bacterium]